MIESIVASMVRLQLAEPVLATIVLMGIRATLVGGVLVGLAAVLRRASPAWPRSLYLSATLALAVLGGVCLATLLASGGGLQTRDLLGASIPAGAGTGLVAADESALQWTADAEATDEVGLWLPLGSGRAGIWLFVWLAPALWIGVRRIRAHRAAAAWARHRTQPLRDSRWHADLAHILGAKERATVALRTSRDVASPVVVGVYRPVIVIPQPLLNSPSALRRAVLRHEVAHVANGDLASRLLSTAVCAVHWFNPLVWALARRQRLESERHCDAEALRDGIEPAHYVRYLVRLAEMSPPRLVPATAIIGSGRHELVRRIELIAERRGVESASARPTALALVAGALLVWLAVTTARPPRARFIAEPGSATLDAGTRSFEADARGVADRATPLAR